MKITYDLEKLVQIVDDICALTGIAMSIMDTKGNYIYVNKKMNDGYCSLIQATPEGWQRCAQCDSEIMKCATERLEVCSHLCHAGLVDTCVPIVKNGAVAGYILVGRVRPEGEIDPERLRSLEKSGIPKEQFLAVTSLSDDRRARLIRLLSTVLTERTVEIDYDAFINGATEYIERHLGDDLSVAAISSALFVSKNYLYRSFHSFFGKTVNEYVTDRRIYKAKELLSSTSKRTAEIATEVGIGNYTYFSKLFKKKTGLSPADFRKIGTV